MNRNEVTELMLDIERSIQMRQFLQERLAAQGDVDLVEEWREIEELDMDIARKIRKHRVE